MTDSAAAYAPGGVKASAVSLVDKAGLLQSTSSATDIGMSGRGFFVVNEAAVPGTGDNFLYTRAGQFALDENGRLRNTAGFFLMGWRVLSDGSFDVDGNGVADPADPDPISLSNLEAIDTSSVSGTAQGTQNVELDLNVAASSAVGTQQNITARIFDSLGVEHNLALLFEKTVAAPATWTLSLTGMTISSSGAASTTLAFPILLDTVTFAGDGTPASFAPTPLAIPAVNWTTGAAAASIAFDIGTVGVSDGITQFASTFTINNIRQDGSGFGRFQALSFGEDGTVSALFDNGDQRPIYKVPISTFSNPNGLKAVSGNAYLETNVSGGHILNQAGVGAAGVVAPSSLESSTVDLGVQFTKMIINQRQFSASSKIITTADEMLEELVRTKR